MVFIMACSIQNWSFLEISLNNVPLPKTKFLQVIVLPGQLNQLLIKGLNLIKELVLRLREFCSAVRTLESCKISLPDGVWSGRQSWNQISCRRFRTGMCTNLSFCLILMRLVLWASSMTFLLLLIVHHRAQTPLNYLLSISESVTNLTLQIY